MNTAIEQYREHTLHISNSQLTTYMSCPLKYKFQYVEGRPWECKSSALVFGSALHSALAGYYTHRMEGDTLEQSVMEQLFEDSLNEELKTDTPVAFKKGEDEESILNMAKALITELYNEEPRKEKVIAVEKSISADIVDPETGEVRDIQLVGIIDLVIQDEEDYEIIIDHKTSSRRYTEGQADYDLQMSIYSILALKARLAYDPWTRHRFDIYLKQKTPSIQRIRTRRTFTERKRMMKIICQVLNAIENQAFYPINSYFCPTCPFSKTCKNW